mmetsp:Transcript_39810/g.62562  ORF Transcript_39810/g.62562 Transcript_39810/m.62562 type:complete len:104 (-) Transcript_39810:20-331(-)
MVGHLRKDPPASARSGAREVEVAASREVAFHLPWSSLQGRPGLNLENCALGAGNLSLSHCSAQWCRPRSCALCGPEASQNLVAASSRADRVTAGPTGKDLEDY